MAKRRRKKRASAGNEFLEDAMDAFMDSAFDRVEGFVERVRDQQRPSFDEDYLRQTFTCWACRKHFDVNGMEQLHPSNGFGTCKGCFSFMVNAAKEKIRAFGSRQQTQQQSAAQEPGAPPAGPLPWEVLGVKQDATVPEIKKAYRKKAMAWHPDRVPADAHSSEKEKARAMFDQIQRAYDVMMKVRKPPT